MIEYDPQAPFRTVFQLHGSVMPKAVRVAIPSALLAAVLVMIRREFPEAFADVFEDSFGDSFQLASFIAFNTTLGFFLIFRTQISYSRFWEAATLIHHARGSWLNVVSAAFAFCTSAEGKQVEVQQFRYRLVRYVSLLHCAGLRSVSVMTSSDFEVVRPQCLEADALHYMAQCPDPAMVLQYWIQRLVVEGMRDGVLDVPPPLLARLFQDLDDGHVQLQSVLKISDTLFPFAYQQMISLLLIIQWVITPFFLSAMTDSILLTTLAGFTATFLSASINYIASEIEIPFGEDPNDLPMSDLQRQMNAALQVLFNAKTLQLPKVVPDMDTQEFSVVGWREGVHDMDDTDAIHKLLLRESSRSGTEFAIPDTKNRHHAILKAHGFSPRFWTHRKQQTKLKSLRRKLRVSSTGVPSAEGKASGSVVEEAKKPLPETKVPTDPPVPSPESGVGQERRVSGVSHPTGSPCASDHDNALEIL
mmetsp:Transcript_35563/g.81505  ORF Transcript_35563/g.81505 Transcript_35563/m.81505 type:complete len:474 (-) Transcript_35563:30-1451(-)